MGREKLKAKREGVRKNGERKKFNVKNLYSYF
jgi:hypothetical protein